MFDKIKHKYWDMVPYNWRPFQLIYRLKCWSWKRYTTVKPRYLPHSWCDRTELLPHMMFELLSQFLEKECSPGIVDWDATPDHKQAMRDMRKLYDWWHITYQKVYPEVENILWEEAEKHYPTTHWEPCNDKILTCKYGEGLQTYSPKFKTKEDKEIYNQNLKAINKLERKHWDDLQKRLHQLIDLREYFWT